MIRKLLRCCLGALAIAGLWACESEMPPAPAPETSAEAPEMSAEAAQAQADADLAQLDDELVFPGPGLCGGPAGLMCAKGSYCRFKTGTCGEGGVFGKCAPIPKVCPKIYAPVCGCNGVTYGNACMAAAAGVSVSASGACPDLGCSTNADCAKSEFCEKDSCTAEEGSCEARPKICTREFAPVCGCNGKTYPNDCNRRAAGVNKAHDGACVQKCGGILGLQCPKGQVCIYEPGTCDISDNMGVCTVPPKACPDVWDPLCGCDGVTYGNKCEATAAGASIDYAGECLPPACTSNADCPGKNQYCAKDEGNCDGKGVCETRPQFCPKFYSPVCGCDGKTYGNACEAAAAGTNVAKQGECDVICGGIAGFECPDGQVCIYPPGTCDIIDNLGKCVTPPQACPDVWAPVCGCDGVTHGNECEATAAGMSIAHKGECPAKACNDNDQCKAGQYCQKKVGNCDGLGQCAPIPQACPLVYAPVCGCDGVTYSNECFAAAAGVNVAATGQCPCKPLICPFDQGPIDADGDGCDDLCVCIYPLDCLPGTQPVDTNGNGCVDTCEPIGCEDNDDCGWDQLYCAKEGCDGKGICEPRPQICITLYKPVCGCDGKTYSNACVAAAAGVNVAKDGPCCASILCSDEQTGVDTDGDGCADKCECAIAIKCQLGFLPHDTNGDGCDDACLPAMCEDASDCPFMGPLPYYCKKDGCEGKGVCVPQPTACPDVWMPVCGCDGKTYGNACEAAAAGINVDYEGECLCANILCLPPLMPIDTNGDGCDDQCICGFAILCAPGFIPVDTNGDGCDDTCEPQGCQTNDDCPQWIGAAPLFCQKDGCDGTGKCVPRPFACPDVWTPVCGCDGKTYSNTCYAHAAGVNVLHDGVCACPAMECIPPLVGTDTDGDGCDDQCICGFAILCTPGSVPVDTNGDGCDDTCEPVGCQTNADCPQLGPMPYFCKKDGCDGPGKCEPQPMACLAVWMPVCGCDGKTYSNTCYANSAGVNVAHDGECACKQILCKFPKMPTDTNGDGCDDTCICGIAIDCVPGYVPVDSDGDGCDDTCKPAPCDDNSDCAFGFLDDTAVSPMSGMYCQKQGCGGQGVCAPRPNACPAIYAPVCGCDGKTYGNACEAAAAGQNVAKQGECPCPPIQCAAPKVPVDTNGDGCKDQCACGIVIDCAPGFIPVDTNGDGCLDQCKANGCQSNTQCPGTSYCAKNTCSGLGQCVPKPQLCPQVFMPVCGCNGVTYSNACMAAAAGMSVAANGPCPSTGGNPTF